jgi:hypothetical protein
MSSLSLRKLSAIVGVMTNRLSIENYYLKHKNAYLALRRSEAWDESYKWDVLPSLNKMLSKLDILNEANASEIIEKLQKANPNSGSFCHWIDFDNLQKLLSKKPASAKALAYVWKVSGTNGIGKEIDAVNNIMKNLFSSSFQLSPAAFGYMLAAQDCNNFAIYSEKLIQIVSDINMTDKPKTQGDKYQLLNDTCRHLGMLMAREKSSYEDYEFYEALNGQDFMYVTEIYDKQRKD